MLAYGVPRLPDFEFSDHGDLAERGAKSRLRKLRSKDRRTTRRYFKRCARAKAKSEIRREY